MTLWAIDPRSQIPDLISPPPPPPPHYKHRKRLPKNLRRRDTKNLNNCLVISDQYSLISLATGLVALDTGCQGNTPCSLYQKRIILTILAVMWNSFSDQYTSAI